LSTFYKGFESHSFSFVKIKDTTPNHRDSVGMGGDMFLSPMYYLEPSELATSLAVLESVNTTSFRIGDYESLKSASLDPYVMMRDFYIEYRKKKVAE
jgi:phospholipid-binding lipoprotein MlaA